jgi:Tfp pilus assembly protein PilF
VIIYTLKNIGICYLALQNPDKAEEYYLQALELMNLVKGPDSEGVVDEELLKEDRE